MEKTADILCIGSVLWDIIGRAPVHMRAGADVPGHITRLPGGVALNIAMTLARFGLRPAVLSAVGRDAQGEELVAQARLLGIECDYLYRSDDLPTDRYMAIEGANGLIAAVADAHSLEQAGDKILRPLRDGRLGRAGAPWAGLVALDGNLTQGLLAQITQAPEFAAADLRVAPASPGKAERLAPLMAHPRATFYVNLEEAGILCQCRFDSAAEAARGLISRGARRVLVTDGGRAAADGLRGPDGRPDILTQSPPEVLVTRVTGAGDTFMAAHIVAERAAGGGAAPPDTPPDTAPAPSRAPALARALAVAARYVSGEMAS